MRSTFITSCKKRIHVIITLFSPRVNLQFRDDVNMCLRVLCFLEKVGSFLCFFCVWNPQFDINRTRDAANIRDIIFGEERFIKNGEDWIHTYRMNIANNGQTLKVSFIYYHIFLNPLIRCIATSSLKIFLWLLVVASVFFACKPHQKRELFTISPSKGLKGWPTFSVASVVA